MNKYVIEVVEDDASVRNLILVTLKSNGYGSIMAVNGQSAIMEAACHNPDIILLDLGLPDMDGVDVIRQIRSWTKTPIIVISARSDDDDKIKALDNGADDYLTKPFSVPELLARLRATQRRIAYLGNADESPVFENGDLTVDYVTRCAYMKGELLKLTPIEYKLLYLLSQNVGRVLTHTYLMQNIWGGNMEGNLRSLRVFMTTLRKKLEQGNESTQYIKTHVGVGYRMVKVDKERPE